MTATYFFGRNFFRNALIPHRLVAVFVFHRIFLFYFSTLNLNCKQNNVFDFIFRRLSHRFRASSTVVSLSGGRIGSGLAGIIGTSFYITNTEKRLSARIEDKPNAQVLINDLYSFST